MAKAASIKLAPGPVGRPLSGHLFAFRKDVLGLILRSTRKFGDVVRFRLGPKVIHLVNHPDHVEHVLHGHAANYDKETLSSDKIRGISGESLLTLSGPAWKRQRRLMQPAFTQERLAGFAPILVEETGRMIDRWVREGRPIDIASEMMSLTFLIVGRTLFGADLGSDVKTVEESFTVVLEHSYERMEHLIDLPPKVPTPANRRFNEALARLDAIVYRILAARRARGEAGDDLLGMLIAARDEGRGMDDQQLRNEALTLLLAGHETTAIALAWTLYLIARHAEVEERVLADPACAGRAFQESMRIYPPIWIMERHAVEADTIGVYPIPAGSSVVISPYAMHRRPDYWTDPERFDMDRFLPDRSAGRPRCAYIPFGMGPRLCIGMHFALLESRIILPQVVQRVRLELLPRQRITPKPGITLRPAGPVWMTARWR